VEFGDYEDMNIQVICDGDGSSATTTMYGVAKYSKHNLQILQWYPDVSKKPDMIYLHYGTLVNTMEDLVKSHPEIKWGVGVVGQLNMFRMYENLYVPKIQYVPAMKLMDGIIALGEKYKQNILAFNDSIPVYEFEVGVDNGMFSRQPPQKYFSIGMAEIFNYPLVDDCLRRFLHYPFPHKMSCGGTGTDRLFHEMPNFYRDISVFIDNVCDPRPGGLMFLEAGAVGRPVLCMKSGILAKWFPDEWLARDDNDMIDKIHSLEDRNTYEKAVNQWCNIAKSRDYSIVAKEFDYAFDKILGS
jgi:hypothetical protein